MNSSADTAPPTVACTLRAAIAAINAGATTGTGCVNSGGAFGSGDLIGFDPGVLSIVLADVANNSLDITTVNDLVIQGPVSITRNPAGTHAFRLMTFGGSGTLTLSGVRLAYGRSTTGGGGGLEVPAGRLTLLDATIEENETNCTACTGGGVYAGRGAVVSNSVIVNNRVLGTGMGGGLASFGGPFTMSNSTVSGNRTTDGCGGGIVMGAPDPAEVANIVSTYIGGNEAPSLTFPYGDGGGVCALMSLEVANSELRGNTAGVAGGAIAITYGGGRTLRVEQSSFSGNGAGQRGGAIAMAAPASGRTHHILNSTFHNNSSTVAGTPGAGSGGALYTVGDLNIDNTTITNNRAGLGGGIFLNGGTLTLGSTIVALSTTTSPAWGGTPNVDIDRNSGTASIMGANNLIQVVRQATAPAGTLTADPNLAPLGNNGCLAPAGSSHTAVIGCPRTQLPQAGSPVFDAGNNTANLTYDQRGAGYPRVIGAAADIGAVEAGGAAPAPGPWPIAVTVLPASAGTVTCTPNPVPNGGNANCTASAAAGYTFSAFSGDCIGGTCALINVGAPRNITARFVQTNPTAAIEPVPAMNPAGLLLLCFGLAWSVLRRAKRGA